MMTRAASFRFSVPTLPKEWYLTLQDAREVYDLTQWQVVILGLACFRLVSTQQDGGADKVKDLAQQIKEMYV